MSLDVTSIGLNANLATGKASGAGAAGTALFSGILKSRSEKYGVDLDALFKKASEKFKVPLNLLKAVGKAESDFDPNATSPCGAMGIMQLMPDTAVYLGVTDAYDPEQNIMGGAKYLSELLHTFGGDMVRAVAGYNAGPGAVEKYGGIPPYEETQNYVKTVMGYLGENITAGTVIAGGKGSTAGNMPTPSDTDKLGTLLETMLLSGGTGDMSDLLNSISNSDPKDVSSKLMASVYQLQLDMLKGNDQDGSSVIV